ncbi:MAG: hypothetical protein ACJAYU_002725 [Bradymonadia bacterium]|jgi:hypothetical protein
MAVSIVLAACGDDMVPSAECSAGESRVVASAELWRAVEIEQDPFYDRYEGDPVVCGAESTGFEVGLDGSWWGIETVRCGYLTLEQEALEPACPGDELVVRLWHFNLLDAGADFQVALAIEDDEPLARETIRVPTSAELVEFRVEVTEAIEAGVMLRFNLSNHGTNSWGLMDIVAE